MGNTNAMDGRTYRPSLERLEDRLLLSAAAEVSPASPTIGPLAGPPVCEIHATADAGPIGGIVWQDFNNDGIRGAREPALPGQIVYLDEDNNGQYNPPRPGLAAMAGEPTATTGPDGRYEFTNVEAGAHEVRLLPQGDWVGSFPPLSERARLGGVGTGDAMETQIAKNPAGFSVSVWTEESRDGDGAGVFAIRRDPNGRPIGGEFQVNIQANDKQHRPSVSVNDAGDFVITWEMLTFDPDSCATYARVFNADGTARTGEIRVRHWDFYCNDTSRVAMANDGGFVVAWDTGAGWGIRAKMYRANGTVRKSEFAVSQGSDERSPAIGMADNGDFVIAWTDRQPGLDIYARRYQEDGTPYGDSFRVNDYISGIETRPTIAVGPQGNFVVAWTRSDYTELRAKAFGADGTAEGNDFVVTTDYGHRASAAIDAAGRFVIAWGEQDTTSLDLVIAARMYSAHDAPYGDEFLVSDDAGSHAAGACAAMDDFGRFAVTFEVYQPYGKEAYAMEFPGFARPDSQYALVGPGQAVEGIDFGARRTDEPPRVTKVAVASAAWAPSFLDRAAGRGLDADGYTIPVGSAAQLYALPWSNLDQVRIAFSEDVTVTQADLAVSGVTVPSYVADSFLYDPSTFTATWTFATPLAADRLLLALDDAVTDGGGNALDGEWIDTAYEYPSGNGSAGGQFVFRINVLPGDVDGSGDVTSADVIKARRKSNTAPGDPDYSCFHDVDGSASINSADVIRIRRLANTSLPPDGPTPPTATASPADPALLAAALDAEKQEADEATPGPGRLDAPVFTEIAAPGL
jgi:hypothetical protein